MVMPDQHRPDWIGRMLSFVPVLKASRLSRNRSFPKDAGGLLSRFGGKVCVCDLESQFDLTQPTISHHLKVLREAGVVDCEMRGLWAYYFVRPTQLQQLRALVGEWLGGQTL